MSELTSIVRDQQLFIGGSWMPGRDRVTVTDRWTSEPLARVHRASRNLAVTAVDAAHVALQIGLPVHERIRVLTAVAAAVAQHGEDFAQMITAEIGKPITAARHEVLRAVTTLTLSAEEAGRLPGEAVPMDATPAGMRMIGFTIPEPRGIVAAITPFNFPLNLVAHKLGPALAAGCPVLFKPSDRAQLVAGMLVQAFIDAGLPAGFLNLVTGDPAEVVSAWQADDRVAVVTFTGSSTVGWALKAGAPRKHHVLELGSNTAMVVAADGDIVQAATDTVAAALSNSGQACVSLQRVYIEKSAAAEYIESVAKLFGNVASGDPRDVNTVVGPLVTDADVDRLMSWIDQAVGGGARVVCGGTARGAVLSPTIVTGVAPSDHLIRDEAFGPIVCVVEVHDLDEAIRLVNDSRYGLNTSIYTNSLSSALAYATAAQAGSVLVNVPPSFRSDAMPYGGVKESGQGREGVRYATSELVQQKLVVMKRPLSPE